jgi:hypothetical protein
LENPFPNEDLKGKEDELNQNYKANRRIKNPQSMTAFDHMDKRDLV